MSTATNYMSQEPQWKREGVKKQGRKTPKKARRKRRQINHWRQKLKADSA